MRAVHVSSIVITALLGGSLTMQCQTKQESSTPAPPVQIARAHKVFLGFGGSGSDKRSGNAAYKATVSALQTDLHLEIVTEPSQADLCLTLSLESIAPGLRAAYYPGSILFVRLAMADAKSQVLLWSLEEYVLPPKEKTGLEKSVLDAVGRLSSDYQALASGIFPPPQW